MPIVLRITPNGVGPRGQWTNVWDILSPSAAYEDAEEAVNYLANTYKDHWAPIAHDSYSIPSFSVIGIGSGLPTVTIVPTVGPIFGGYSTQQLLPAQVALLLRFASVSQRPNRARKYIAGLTEDGWTGGAWTAGTLTFFQNFGQEMVDMATLTPSALEFGVARVAPGGALVTFTQMTQHGTDPYAVTQRRRRG